MDPAKMKVVDLRSELGALGLDTKGNKPALVERLRKALESKTGKRVLETSILDTSTEDAEEPPTPRRAAARTTRRTSSSRLAATPVKVAREDPPATIQEKEEEVKETPKQASPVKKPKEQEKAPEPQPDLEPEPEPEPEPEVKEPEVKEQEVKESEEKPAEEEEESKEEEPQEKPQKMDEDQDNDSQSSVKEEEAPENVTPPAPDDPEPTSKESSVKAEQEMEVDQPPVESEFEKEVGKQTEAEEAMEQDKEGGGVKENEKEDEKDREESGDEKERQHELTEEEEWDILNEKLRVKEQERIEREKKQAEDDARLLEEYSDNPIKLQRLKRKQEKKARWSNYYRTIEATNEILTPPPEPIALLPRKDSVEQKPVEPELNDNRVTLSWYDSDLNQYLELPELNSVVALSEGVFCHAWAGARASHGVNSQRVCFEVRVGSTVTTNEAAEKDSLPNGLRIGWSTDDSTLHLGEGELSFGYESTGKAFNNGEFKEYGKVFTEKDVIGAYLDLESSPCKVFYTLNGVELGTAFEFDKEKLGDRALFPHVLTKNVCYKVNMGYERYNFLTRTKIVRKRIEVPIEEVLEEKRQKEEEIRKIKEEATRKRQERQKKKREERERADRERKDREEQEKKEKEKEKMETDQEEQKETKEDAETEEVEKKDEEQKPEEEAPKEAVENGDKPEETEEKPAEVKLEPMEEEDSKAKGDDEVKEESGQLSVLTEELAHALDKRVKFVIRHTVEEELDGAEACLVPGYVFISQAEHLIEGPRRPNTIAECEDSERRSGVI